MRHALNSEQGHVGSTVAGLFAIVAGIVASLGIGLESKVVEIVGVCLFAFALVLGTQAVHLWHRKVARRLDRMTDENDPDRDVRPRLRIEF